MTQLRNFSDHTTGDFANFEFQDGEEWKPARISRSALATLAKGDQRPALEIFLAHHDAIARAVAGKPVDPRYGVPLISSDDLHGV